jgi:manganese/zinc/iron transport system permease protein
MNPYWGKTFFPFLALFVQRMFQLCTGQLRLEDLASDEIQVLVLALIGCSSVLVGAFLVLRKMTMLANSLSHTILLGIVLAYLATRSLTMDIGVLLLASLVTGLLTTLLTQFLTVVVRLQEDASIGLVFTVLFALGIVLVTLYTRNAHIGTEAIMGNADALHLSDLKLAALVAAFNFLLVALFFKEYQIVSFDPNLARALGFSVAGFSTLLMLQTAATAIGAFRAVGVLLFLALLVGPFLTARRLAHRLLPLMGLAIGLSACASLIAVGLTRHCLSVYRMPLSTSGMVVAIIALFYVITLSRRSAW